jgi:hypothetical protein
MGIRKSYSKMAIAAAFALAAGVAVNAQAAIDMTDDVDDDALTFATEIDVDATDGTALANNAAGDMNTTADLGFARAADMEYFIRFDLSNSAEFAADPTSLQCGDGAAGAADDDGTKSAGGAGESYVIYSLTAGADRSSTDDCTLTIAGDGITVFNQDPVTITYRMYETATAASNQGDALATDSETMIQWGAVLVAEVDTVTPNKIDVTQGSVYLDGKTEDVVTVIGDVNIDVDGTTLWTDGAAAAMDDLVAAGTDLVISGDFTAAETVANNGVFFDADGDRITCNTVTAAADEITDTSATYTLDDNAIDAYVCLTVDGTTSIPESSYVATYDVTAAAGSGLADQNLGTISELEKNGSFDRLTFALTPEGAYSNLIRITNPSTLAGNVYITVTNDAGESVQIQLGDIEGVDSTSLAAGASTGLININDVYAAATAADDTFAHNGGKLRLDIDAEFGETGQASGVVVNAFSMTTDGTGFFMM